jgi:transposase
VNVESCQTCHNKWLNFTSIIMKALPAAQCNHILSLLDSGHSGNEISSITGVGTTTVTRLHSRYRPYLHKSSGGHPSKLSTTDIRHAIHLIGTGKAENAVEVTRVLRDVINQPLSAQTVCNSLKDVGLKAMVKKKRPLLTKRHRKERMDFALTHKDWTVEDWKTVVWSDETKINRLGSDGRKWVWKKPGEGLSDRLVEGTKKFGGGSLMMWGCMAWEGVGYACKIDGNMDGDLYTKILQDELQESISFYDKNPGDFIFQQDNDSKHTCKKAQKWLEDQGYQVLLWPAQSPDLNPIEHLWTHLKRRLAAYETPPNGILQLWERVQVEWDKIESEMCQGLIESMPRRMEALLKAKGGYTKY